MRHFVASAFALIHYGHAAGKCRTAFRGVAHAHAGASGVMPSSDDLTRFLSDQDRAYSAVLDELRHGEKQSHWMWFIFPQLAGLGRTPQSRKFAIANLDEATRYLAHPVLGPRLLECATLVLGIKDKSAIEVFGETDAMKLRSSATLFAQVSPAGSVFHRILARYFNGARDERTLELLAAQASPLG